MALPVGHSLAGLSIARKTDIDPKLAIVLSNLPDIDYFFGLFLANGNMLAYHRSPLTHTPPFALFVMLVFYIFGLVRRKPYTQKQLAGIGLIVLSHWFLDYVFTPLPYKFDKHAGTDGLYDFLAVHIIGIEFAYNSMLDLGFFGSLYVLVWKIIFKEPLWPFGKKKIKKKR